MDIPKDISKLVENMKIFSEVKTCLLAPFKRMS